MRAREHIWMRSALLLVAEILFIISSAVWSTISPDSKWLSLLYGILFCAGGYVLSTGGRWLLTYLLFVIPAFVLSGFDEGVFFPVVKLICISGSFVLLFRAIFFHAMFRPKVNHIDRVFAGIAGYILLGIFWTVQCEWVTLCDSSAFLNMATSQPATQSEMLYFNFVTLTTLGYGDIIPVTPMARIPVLFNSLSGALYLAVFVASLIGGFHKQEKRD